jgi:hypothetical protein
MMITILLTMCGFLLISGVMAVGLLIGGSPLKGSCGGKGGPECVCDDFEQRKCAARSRMLESKLKREQV